VILKISPRNRKNDLLSMRKQYAAKKILSLYPSFYTEVIEKIMAQQDGTTDG
jgi:hypothetical protein